MAPRPTIRGADLCFRWSGSIDNAAGLLNKYEILIIDGPARRVTPTGLPALSPTSGIRVATLLELMAVDGTAAHAAI